MTVYPLYRYSNETDIASLDIYDDFEIEKNKHLVFMF